LNRELRNTGVRREEKESSVRKRSELRHLQQRLPRRLRLPRWLKKQELLKKRPIERLKQSRTSLMLRKLQRNLKLSIKLICWLPPMLRLRCWRKQRKRPKKLTNNKS